MPVSDTHPLYDKHTAKATLTRDVINGDDAVKAKKTTYVPKLSDQTTEEYNAYLNRPSLHNYTDRVLDGLTGLAFGKDIQIEVSPTLEKMLDDISLSNTTVHDFAEELLSDVMTDGRGGILVDMAFAKEGLTQQEAEALNLRPYLSRYTDSSIINWKYSNINNRIKLSMAVLKEEAAKDTLDEFSQEVEDVYRVLSLKDNIYTVRMMKEDGTQIGDEVIPKMNGKPLDFIPFIGVTPSKLSLTPAKPPMYDMAKINLTQFKIDVDFYHGMHFTALPTPYISGHQMEKDQVVRVGSTTFLTLPDPQAKMAFLEFSGDGLGTIEREKDKLYDSMVVLGSNLLRNDGNKAEASETVRMRAKGNYASLSSTCSTVSRAITKALEIMEQWVGGSKEVVFKINTDFTDTIADANTINATVNAWLTGAISDKEKFNKLKKDGVIVDQNKTFEDHKGELEVDKVEVD